MKARRVALDGAQRRRIYLFRHGAVDYVDAEGKLVVDPDAVALNDKGQAQKDRKFYRVGEVWGTESERELTRRCSIERIVRAPGGVVV